MSWTHHPSSHGFCGSPMLTRCRLCLPTAAALLPGIRFVLTQGPGSRSIDGGAPRQDHIDASCTRSGTRVLKNAWLAAERVVTGRGQPAGLCAWGTASTACSLARQEITERGIGEECQSRNSVTRLASQSAHRNLNLLLLGSWRATVCVHRRCVGFDRLCE